MKTCIYCNEHKHLEEYPRHIHSSDNYDNRCKECVKLQSQIRKELKKHAPPKPEFCECCGKIPVKWCLDHDHSTNKFRGWLCDKCNTAIGNLGDDMGGIVNALNYFLSRKNNG